MNITGGTLHTVGQNDLVNFGESTNADEPQV